MITFLRVAGMVVSVCGAMLYEPAVMLAGAVWMGAAHGEAARQARLREERGLPDLRDADRHGWAQ